MKPRDTPPQRFTPWCPDSINPVRVGVYQIDYKCGLQFSFWNGVHWGFRMLTANEADEYRYKRARGSVVRWRGLAEEPK